MPIRWITVVLLAFMFLTQFVETLYLSYQIELPLLYSALQPIGFLWLIWSWLIEDSRRVGTTWPLDLGMFLGIGWFVILPFHMIKKRGARAALGILAFLGAAFLGWLCAAVVIVAQL